MHSDLQARTPRNVIESIPKVMAALTLTALITSGCAMNETQQRTGTGAAIGALGGALIGTSRESAAIGAAVGAAGGFLFDQYQQRSDAQAENEQLRQENARLQNQANQ
jgi:osmotically inducible lipoprotein OsmB